MDSPIRKTRPEDMHNIRELTRGGIVRKVWDEWDEDGKVVKTAVWDILDRSGNPIGEQSWDEYEEYVDSLREQALLASDPNRKREKAEQRLAQREEAKRRKEERLKKNREELAASLELFYEEHPDPLVQMPVYKFYPLILPYLANKMTRRRMTAILVRNKEFFSDMGFTFSTGWSRLSRTECLYVGYLTTIKEEDIRARESRDEEIKAVVDELPKGQYGRLRLTAIVYAKYRGISKSNLGWILARNAYRFGLSYSWDSDMFIKE